MHQGISNGGIITAENNIDRIHSLKGEIPGYTERHIYFKSLEEIEEQLSILKFELFWREVLHLFEDEILRTGCSVSKIEIHVNLEDGTITFKYETDKPGTRKTFVSGDYAVSMLQNVMTSPVDKMGFIRKSNPEDKIIVFHVWYPA